MIAIAHDVVKRRLKQVEDLLWATFPGKQIVSGIDKQNGKCHITLKGVHRVSFDVNWLIEHFDAQSLATVIEKEITNANNSC